MKQVLITLSFLIFGGIGMALAVEDNANDSGTYKPYTCEPNDEGVETCYCAGRYDCNYMISDGVCDVPMPELGEHATGNDMVCDNNFGNVGEYVCECSAERTGPGVSRRPDTVNVPTENAPSEQANETVPARRGTAPVSDTTAEEDGEEASPPRRVRDHRQ